MDHAKQAVQKERRKTGGDANYWLQIIPSEISGLPETVVEAEDIIEATHMEFHLATVFKSAWRLCKNRQGLGKPGSTNVYEAEKVVYYSKRTLDVSQRFEQSLTKVGLFLRRIRNLFVKDWVNIDPLDIVIEVKDPKRLEPFKFVVRDLIAALGADRSETFIFAEVLRIAVMRMNYRFPNDDAITNAGRLLTYAQLTLRNEQAIASPPGKRKI